MGKGGLRGFADPSNVFVILPISIVFILLMIIMEAMIECGSRLIVDNSSGLRLWVRLFRAARAG